MTTAIVGGGAAGLSLAMMLPDSIVYEKEKVAGGLCRAENFLGYPIDIGPHILGGIPEAVSWIQEHTDIDTWVERETNNATLIEGQLAPHPMESEEHAYEYQTKMWKTLPVELSTAGLTAQRQRRPGGVKRFAYPLSGAYQAITDSWLRALGDRVKTKVEITDPMELWKECSTVVWTAPVRDPRLRYNGLTVATVMCEGEAPEQTAIYLPEKRWTFHRLSLPGNINPECEVSGGFLLQGEASWPPGEAPSIMALQEELNELAEMLGGRPGASVYTSRRYAYPVPTTEAESWHRASRGGMRVFFHGRQGRHAYLNIDGIVHDSMQLARILDGTAIGGSYGPGDDAA